MALPPFNDLRLKKGEWPKQARLEELLEGYARNFEDLYNRYATTAQVQEVNSRQEIAGIVESTGTKISGTGFTSEKSGTGTYVITLSSELSTDGSFVATPIGARLVPATLSASKKVYTVVFATVAGVATDVAFSFIIRQT